jgi:hypothetical protein
MLSLSASSNMGSYRETRELFRDREKTKEDYERIEHDAEGGSEPSQIYEEYRYKAIPRNGAIYTTDDVANNKLALYSIIHLSIPYIKLYWNEYFSVYHLPSFSSKIYPSHKSGKREV